MDRIKCLGCQKIFPVGDAIMGEAVGAFNRVRETAHCPFCGNNLLANEGGSFPVKIKGTVTKAACSADCQMATSVICNCSCGGANHGTPRRAAVA